MAVALICAPFSQLDAVMRVEIDDAVASASIQAARERRSERLKKSTFKTFFTVLHGDFDCPLFSGMFLISNVTYTLMLAYP